jgi:hypothetical protein
MILLRQANHGAEQHGLKTTAFRHQPERCSSFLTPTASSQVAQTAFASNRPRSADFLDAQILTVADFGGTTIDINSENRRGLLATYKRPDLLDS